MIANRAGSVAYVAVYKCAVIPQRTVAMFAGKSRPL